MKTLRTLHHPPQGARLVAKAMMTDAALAMLAGDPARVEKAEAALSELRRAEAGASSDPEVPVR